MERVGNALIILNVGKERAINRIDYLFSLEYILPFSSFKNHEHFLCLFLVRVDLRFIQQTLIRDTTMRQVDGFGAEDMQMNKIVSCGRELGPWRQTDPILDLSFALSLALSVPRSILAQV